MRKRILFIISATILIIVLGMLIIVSQKGDINIAITAEKAADLIEKNLNNPDFIILDVRTPAEYKSGAIAGAKNIDLYAADFKTRLNELDRRKTYLVYCRTANRSGQAVEMMKGFKFTHVYDLSGGIVKWSQKGYPLIKP
jgi:rhodanese-related sulfurtransferase